MLKRRYVLITSHYRWSGFISSILYWYTTRTTTAPTRRPSKPHTSPTRSRNTQHHNKYTVFILGMAVTMSILIRFHYPLFYFYTRFHNSLFDRDREYYVCREYIWTRSKFSRAARFKMLLQCNIVSGLYGANLDRTYGCWFLYHSTYTWLPTMQFLNWE